VGPTALLIVSNVLAVAVLAYAAHMMRAAFRLVAETDPGEASG
jgi:hypothetical protein